MKAGLIYLLLVAVASANPTVSNIRVAQRENTKLVDIIYDVSFIGGDTVAVSCEVSTNAGVSFDVPASSFSGDGYGAIVSNGTDRLIVWNAAIDWDENYSDQMKVRITATPPRFIVNGDGTITDTQTDLIWQRRAYIGASSMSLQSLTFNDAVVAVESYGEGWRIPTHVELSALKDWDTFNAANPNSEWDLQGASMPVGHPFIISSGIYWSSSTFGFTLSYGEPHTLIHGFSFYSHMSSYRTGSTSIAAMGIITDSESLALLLAVKDIN